MGTRQLTADKKKRKPSIKGLTHQQQQFVNHMLASMNFCGTEAARKAGYEHPSQAANKLLKQPEIKRALEHAKGERDEKTGIDSADVWSYLYGIINLNPFQFLEAAPEEEGGGWYVLNPKEIPAEVARYIDYWENVRVKGQDGVFRTRLIIKFVSKAHALDIAARHALSVDINVKQETAHHIEWGQLYQPPSKPTVESVIEGMLTQASKVTDVE